MFNIASFSNLCNDPEKYGKEFSKQLHSGACWTINKKATGEFTGFFTLINFIDKKEGSVKYSRPYAALLPEYRRMGFFTEVTEKILHFAFLGVKTPLVCAGNASGKILQKCGFKYHKEHDQYRYILEDYLKNNSIKTDDKKNIYDYSPPVKKSPYSYEKPVRKINGISFVKEPSENLRGQSVIAMLAGVSVDEAVDVIGHGKSASVPEMVAALAWYGIRHDKRKRCAKETALPGICVLRLKSRGFVRWSLFYKGEYYDPEFGVVKKLPPNSELKNYWEVW